MKPSEKTNEVAALRERVAALEARERVLAEMLELSREHATACIESIKVIAAHVGLWRSPEADASAPAPRGPVQ